MKEIPLTKGYVALVDDADYEILSSYRWYALVHSTKTNTRIYATTTTSKDGKTVSVYMHRMLTGFTIVDHADSDGLNNQRSNLREVTQSQNLANMRKTRGVSKFKGVYWSPEDRKWKSKIQKHGKRHTVGSFRDEVDAATAYNFVAFELFGEHARMNVPIP